MPLALGPLGQGLRLIRPAPATVTLLPTTGPDVLVIEGDELLILEDGAQLALESPDGE